MISWAEAIDQLSILGYSVTLRGGKLKYTYHGKDNPAREQTTFLIDVLKSHRDEILNDPCFLIDEIVKEINEAWEPGTLDWLKRSRPNDWNRILALEGKINRLTLKKDMNGLKEALERYRTLFLSTMRIYKNSHFQDVFIFKKNSPG